MDDGGKDEFRDGGDGSGDGEEDDVVERDLGMGDVEADIGADDGGKQEYVARRGDEAVMSSRAFGRLSRA